eukprot:15358599-Ditylum_brightwellii.AAC.2
MHGYDIVKGGHNHIEMSLKMGCRVATFSIKQCSKLSEHLHHTFVKGSLRDMNAPHDKCFRVPELEETKCLQWDDEMSDEEYTCMLGETVALANE